MRAAVGCVLGVGLSFLVASAPRDASACGLARISFPPPLPSAAPAQPTNVLFDSSALTRSSGATVSATKDEALSSLLGTPVFHAENVANETVSIDRCAPLGPACAASVPIGASADHTPPSRARIAKVVTQIVRHPGSCEADALRFYVEGQDDWSARSDLTVLAFIGRSEAAVRGKSVPDDRMGLLPDDPSAGPWGDTVFAALVQPRASGAPPWNLAGRFCFALALMDQAGNVGERSEPFCLDTTDEKDPTVVVVEGVGCASASGNGLGLLVVAGLLARRRARVRPALHFT